MNDIQLPELELDLQAPGKQLRYDLARDLARGFASSGQIANPQLLAEISVKAADALLDLLSRDPAPKEPFYYDTTPIDGVTAK